MLLMLHYNKGELACAVYLGGWYNHASLKVQISCHHFLFPNKLGQIFSRFFSLPFFRLLLLLSDCSLSSISSPHFPRTFHMPLHWPFPFSSFSPSHIPTCTLHLSTGTPQAGCSSLPLTSCEACHGLQHLSKMLKLTDKFSRSISSMYLILEVLWDFSMGWN